MFKLKQTEEELIEEMHNEFDTAPDRLLENALNIMNEAEGNKVSTEQEVLDKARRLYTLGFKNTEIVTKMKVIKERNEEQDKIISEELEMAKKIKHYNKTYPNNKFLTHDELNRICKKYGLVYAPVEHYTKTVPTENLEEIEENTPNIQSNDSPYVTHYIHWSLSNNYNTFLGNHDVKSWENPMIIETKKDVKFSKWDVHRLLRERNKPANAFDINESETYVKTDERNGLFIAAPKKHFNTQGLTFDGTHGFFSMKRKKLIKTDPVVFKFVKDGVLVITKWGLVGEDPLLQS